MKVLALSKLKRAKEIFEWIDNPNVVISKPQVIYQAQEASELAFKAIFDMRGINYEKTHDLSQLLQKYETVLPFNILENLKSLKEDLNRLTEQRTTAKYNHMDISPRVNEPSYSESDVQKAKNTAWKLIHLAQEFVEQKCFI